MKNIDTVLVTGCGGDIGQSVGKIIKMEYKNVKLVGSDIHDKHAAHFIFDRCFVVPRVESPEYEISMKKLIDETKPDIIIPLSEAELRYFFKNKITNFFCVPMIMPNFKSMSIGNDKLLTQKFLKDNGLPHAWTVKVGDGKPKGFPCILKNVDGRGGKGLKIIKETNNDNEFYQEKDLIYQEYLLPDDEEYTCGLFRSKDGEVRSIIIHRLLLQGYTHYGEVVTNNEIEKLLKTLAEKLDLVGSINVQLRLTETKGPVIFEINPRFSSTVLFRHMVYFKDVVWCLKDFYDEPLEEYVPSQSGAKIFKGWQEYVLYKNGKKATVDNAVFELKFS